MINILKKKISIKKVIAILIILLLVIIIFFKYKPFNSIKTEDIKTVQHYSRATPNFINELTKEETEEFLDILSEFKVSLFPIFTVRKMTGGLPTEFSIKLKDGTVYDIATKCNDYLSINGKPFLVSNSALKKMKDFHFEIVMKYYQDDTGEAITP